jgi:hypothetical protein
MDISGPPSNYKEVPLADFQEWLQGVHRNWRRVSFNFDVYYWTTDTTHHQFAFTRDASAWVDPALLK